MKIFHLSNKVLVGSSFLLFFLGVYSCSKFEPSAPEINEVMNVPIDNLTASQNQLFNAGAEEFDENYTSSTGLGPLFVSTSCASCHAEDNRGHISLALIRFGQSDTTGNPFVGHGGPQIQNRALFGYTPESVPDGVVQTKLIAPIVAGVGFLENVPESQILELSDPFDSNGDGISGVPNWNFLPNWVESQGNSTSQNGRFLCRFGRKGATYNVFQQTTQAFNQDIGITTTFLPENPGAESQISYATPDIPNESLEATVFYLQTLQPPYRRNISDSEILFGELLFEQIGCESCHRSTFTTGPSHIEGLSYKTIHPYSDLLLHDMGPGLDDGYTEGSAMTYEWKTTPLWGLGLAKTSQGGVINLMHDGRAHSIEEAILLHGGEGSISVDQFNNLSNDERKALIKFLESL